MAEIYPVLIVCGVAVLTVLLACLAGMVLGAWIHHKGVSLGSGANAGFTGNPKGEVFTIEDESGGDYPEEDGETNAAAQRVSRRSGQFMDMFTTARRDSA